METVVEALAPATVSPKKLRILALVGRRYSGKSTVGELVTKFDPRFTLRSFSTVLKQEYCKQSGVEMKKLNTPGIKDIYRPGMFEYEKRVKAENPHYFAEKLFERIQPGEFTVIDDLRFIEELKMCVEHDAVIYKVHAEPHDRRERGWIKSDIDEHYSETELDLPGYWFWLISGKKGGTLFNTRSDKEDPDRNYLRSQVVTVMRSFFPLQF